MSYLLRAICRFFALDAAAAAARVRHLERAVRELRTTLDAERKRGNALARRLALMRKRMLIYRENAKPINPNVIRVRDPPQQKDVELPCRREHHAQRTAKVRAPNRTEFDLDRAALVRFCLPPKVIGE